MKRANDREAEKKLIERILRRDRGALFEFYNGYVPGLRRYVYSKIGKREDADEVLQDVLFAFLESLRDFRGKSSIKTFLYAIGHNKVVDYYRRRKIKKVVFSQLPQLESLVSPFLTPEDELDAQLLSEKIVHTFGMILPRYRQILTLKYLEDRSVESIAKKLSISFKSAESRLFRARKAFVLAFDTVHYER